MRECDVKNNLNARRAYLHVIGDAISSMGVILAGLLIWNYSWYIVAPVISGHVALVIAKGAIGVIKQAIHILMEGKPSFLDTHAVKCELCQIDEYRYP